MNSLKINSLNLLPTWEAIYTIDGGIRRIWFEAPGESEAKEIAKKCGAGLTGNSPRPVGTKPKPEVYDLDTTRELLGGVSRPTIYRQLKTGALERVPGISKVLVTRTSIERLCRSEI